MSGRNIEKIISKEELQDSLLHFHQPVWEIARDHNTDTFTIKAAIAYYQIPGDFDTSKSPAIIYPRSMAGGTHYVRLLQRCQDFGIKYSSRHHNTVLFHNRQETWHHFIAKCLLSKTLRDQGHDVFSEMAVGTGIMDLIDLDTGIVYEIESRPGPKTLEQKQALVVNTGLCVVIIDLRDAPKVTDDVHMWCTWFRLFILEAESEFGGKR